MKYEIDCVHFPECSGCVVNSCKNPPAIFEQAAQYFKDFWQCDLGYKQGDICGWRTRAKLAVRPENSIGLFKKGTHQVMDIPHCRVHHPKINEARERVVRAGFSSYDERTHKGDLRYIQCIVERKTQKVNLTLVLNGKCKVPLDSLYDPNFWHSIWCNYNDSPTNTIFSKSWEKIVGEEFIWEEIAGLHIPFGPSHFTQANLQMYEELIFDLQKQTIPNATVCELYAGIGVIGLALAHKSKEVRLVEVEASSKDYFLLAQQKNGLHNLHYYVSKAEESLEQLVGADVCIVDPPRKGLGPALLRKILATQGLKQLAYIACDYTSLQRDLEQLPPNWRVSWACSYLFFPGTNQIETLVFLSQIN